MLYVVNSAGVSWWGFMVGDAWVLSALVVFFALAASAYLALHFFQQRRS